MAAAFRKETENLNLYIIHNVLEFKEFLCHWISSSNIYCMQKGARPSTGKFDLEYPKKGNLLLKGVQVPMDMILVLPTCTASGR